MKPPEFNRTLRQLVTLPVVLLILMAGFLVWQIVAAAAARTAIARRTGTRRAPGRRSVSAAVCAG